LIKKIAHIVFSAWLSLLLLLGTTPKEFIHSFTNHKDTVDKLPSKGFVIDNKHHHCVFLGFNLMPFAEGYQQPIIHFTKQSFQIQHFAVTTVFIPRNTAALSLRGPPVC
jgi:hypothetical protein